MKKAVDNLCVYDPEFSGYAEAFLSDLGGSSATAAVTSIEDLKAALEEHACELPEWLIEALCDPGARASLQRVTPSEAHAAVGFWLSDAICAL